MNMSADSVETGGSSRVLPTQRRPDERSRLVAQEHGVVQLGGLLNPGGKGCATEPGGFRNRAPRSAQGALASGTPEVGGLARELAVQVQSADESQTDASNKFKTRGTFERGVCCSSYFISST